MMCQQKRGPLGPVISDPMNIPLSSSAREILNLPSLHSFFLMNFGEPRIIEKEGKLNL